jgi:hypothetical protein
MISIWTESTLILQGRDSRNARRNGASGRRSEMGGKGAAIYQINKTSGSPHQPINHRT